MNRVGWNQLGTSLEPGTVSCESWDLGSQLEKFNFLMPVAGKIITLLVCMMCVLFSYMLNESYPWLLTHQSNLVKDVTYHFVRIKIHFSLQINKCR